MDTNQKLLAEKNNINVIIIDDNHADNILFSRYLGRSLTTEFNTSYFESIEQFQKGQQQNPKSKPSIILLAAELNNSILIDNIQIVQEYFPNLPIIITREYIDERLAIDLNNYNIYGYIAKNESNEVSLVNTLIACDSFYSKIKNVVIKANYDPLTNLANRELIKDRIQHAISLCSRSKKIMALLMIDLDDFKQVNDNYGHDFGDIFLKNISTRLKDSVRVTDTVARMGGDEFTILLEGIDYPEMAGQIAKKILANVCEPMNIKGKTIIPSLSIGLSLLSHTINNRFSYDWLMQSADKALYQAKQNGKNTYSIFSDENDDEMMSLLELEDQIQSALEQEDFTLYYQPIFNVFNNQLSGCEALLRWKKSTGEIIEPDKFLKTTEHLGLTKELGDIVIKQSLAQYSEWLANGMHAITLHINTSPAQFGNDNFFNDFKSIMTQYNLPSNNIVLELTEQQLFKNTRSIEREFKKLNWYGVKIAIDDFGTGYNSYDYIRRFKIDTIKLDKGFVSSMFNSPLDMAIIQSITKFANELNINLVAEGVETRKQWDYLSSIGVDQIQGFYKGRPMPANDFYKTFVGNSFISKKDNFNTNSKTRIYYQ
tara:strand:+ start:11449 stop:13242 length:1794 start_codon:yes stop_codon:yes gene_type:complete